MSLALFISSFKVEFLRYFRRNYFIMSSIGSMNITLKNNRKLLKNGKRPPFTKMNGTSPKKLTYKRYTLPHMFPHKIRRVRIKTRRSNRRLLIKKVIIAVIGFIGLLYWIYTF